MTRVHSQNTSYHWAIEKEPCPECKAMKQVPCQDQLTHIPFNPNTVHVARVRANGYNVL